MNLVPTKTPLVVKKMFPNYVWDIATTDKVMYLTFDDGPTPEITNWTLDQLDKSNAKATFFCIGSNVENHPDIFKKIISNGHSIGNHTQNHIKGWTTKTKLYLENTFDAQQVINSQINSSTKVNLFRPPYGQITQKQGKKLIELGYKIIMWDVLSFDWDNTIANEDCYRNVITKAKKGSIIVFHDSIKASERLQYTLPKVLDYFSEQGFIFKSLSD